MKNQMKPKMSMKKTVTKVSVKAQPAPKLKTAEEFKKANAMAAKKKADMAAKKEAERRKALGITGRIKEDVKSSVKDLKNLKGSGYGRL
jgi:RNA polymerase-binding transcription factor DksA